MSLTSPALAGGFFTTSTTWEVPYNMMPSFFHKTFFFIYKTFFLCVDHFLKSLLNFLQYCPCFVFQFFGTKACAILAPQSGIEPALPTLKGEDVLTTRPQGSPCHPLSVGVTRGHSLLGEMER